MLDFFKKLSAACLITTFSLALSASAADFKIGYVDVQKVLTSSTSGKAAQKDFDSERKKLQEKINTQKVDFEKSQESYKKQKDSLSDKARAEKEEQIINSEKELKRSLQDAEESLRRKNMQLVGSLVEKIRKLVEEYAKEENYTMVLEKNGQSIIYANTDLDITDEIVKKFDK
ncbi:MAG: OmpH family outer membrane protein [Proteobacteria bacterium]|nr:OmpH family outer membrane protein [Pseudomonadota bacterium]